MNSTEDSDDNNREGRLTSAALEAVEKRLYDGTATAEETVAFLRSSGEL